MKKEYNFSGGVRGKFHRVGKVQKTLRIDKSILHYFQKLSKKCGVPYQTLINLALRKFAAQDEKIVLSV